MSFTRRLDRSKPYGDVFGPTGHFGYDQGGIYFGLDGNLMRPEILKQNELQQPEGYDKMPAQPSRGETSMRQRDEPKGPESLLSPDALAELAGLATIAPRGGCFLEAGVYKGGSAWHIAKIVQSRGETFYLCDTFDGIPYEEDGDIDGQGDLGDVSPLDVSNAIPAGNAKIETVVGIFPDSMSEGLVSQIAFAHLHLKQQRSYRDAVPWLLQNMMPGGIIVLQDYGATPGLTKYLDEVFPGQLNRTNSGAAFVVLPK